MAGMYSCLDQGVPEQKDNELWLQVSRTLS